MSLEEENKMSLEEDNIELRDLVAQTLEANGVLSNIKAQLRASIFLALDEDEKISNQKPLFNNKVKTYLETEEGKAMFCIVHDFLEFCGLKFTLSVYEPESYLETKLQLEERQRIMEKLGVECNETIPILLHLLRSATAKSKSIEINLNMGTRVDQDKSASENSSDSFVRTMTVSDCSDVIENKAVEVKTVNDEHKFNATFDLSSPTVNVLKHPEKRENLNMYVETNRCRTRNEEDEPASSPSCSDKLSSEISARTTDEIVTKDSPPKSDKLKPKNGSISMTDLPPLQLNKSRANDILPSLYSKEFKEKSNLRELDKLFEMDAEYEEDFICDVDDLSLNSERSKVNLLEELQNATRNGSTDKPIALMKHDKHKQTSREIPDNKS